MSARSTFRRIFGPVACIGIALTSMHGDLQAQEAVTLGDPTATAAEPFSNIAGLRELSDGTLLVSDGLEGRLYRVSADLSSARPVGREGGGPEEYRTPDLLFPIAGDSTVMFDLGNGRIAVLDPDARIVRTTPAARGEGRNMALIVPGGADAEGRLYFRAMARPGPSGLPDSALVRRFDPADESFADLANSKIPSMAISRSGGAGNQNVSMRPVPLSAQDSWAVSPTGTLALARSDGAAYWLETTDGSGIRKGPRIAYDPVRVGNADKDEWIASQTGGLGVGMEMENGRARASFSRGGAPSLDKDDMEWPEVKPAFPAGALRAAPDGTFWLRRHMPAGSPPRYDVLDAGGRRVGRVDLPEGRTLEGFGDGSVYLSRSDDLEFVWLERYAHPTF